jgi:putative ABC transport system permease protein
MAASFAALAVGATLASAFLNLYFDLPRKMTTEFRTLGANLILAPKGTSETLPEEVYRELAEAQPATPRLAWLYAVGKVNGQEAILAGTELERLAALNPGWQVLDDPSAKRSSESIDAFIARSARAQGGLGNQQATWLLAGETAATHFGWKAGEAVTVNYGSATLDLQVIGIISTGGSEDSQLLLPLPALQEITGHAGQLSLIALAAPGAAAQVEAVRQQLARRWPEIDVRPLRPVLESEARVILKVRGLMFGLTAIVLAIVILSVMTTVSGLVLDRQRDIGVMKSLGGSDWAISLLFVAETLSIAAVAALLGYALGLGLAQWAAQRIFASALPWRWDTLPAVVGVTLAVAFLAATLPVYRVRRLDPAVVLRGN